jgi:hypothetical protein
MANLTNANTLVCDADSSSGTAGSYVKGRCELYHVVTFSDAVTDTVKIYDMAQDGTTAIGNLKLSLIYATAKDVKHHDFSGAPLIFPNGIWVDVGGSPVATLVYSRA